MIPAGVEARLREHVASVLAAARIPATDGEEIAEELYGHLVERVRRLVADGMEPEVAADRAIRDFGAAERIGDDFTRTYHGRLWASTIGVLLPAETPAGRPLAVTLFWILALAMSAVYLLLAGWALVHHPPIRAIILGVGGIMVSGAIFLVGFGLRRAQRWAVDVATAGSFILVIFGLVELMAGNISLAGLLALIALIAYASDRSRVHAWLSSAPEPRGAIFVAAVALLLPFFQHAGVGMPDPTQAGPEDVNVHLAIECAPRRVELVAQVEWDRISLLPGGLANLDQYGDVLVLDHPDEDVWVLDNYPTLIDTSTGEVVAEPDVAYAPNQERTFAALRGPHVIQVAWDALKPGTRYRAEWILKPHDAIADQEALQVGIEYIHADRFRWEALADCYRGVHEPFVSEWP